jgi:hypothetical protein
MGSFKRFDYSKAKNETAARNQARADLTALFLEFVKEKFGEEDSGLVDKDTIAFVFGDAVDKDGYPCDMAATLKIIVKNYQDHCGTKKYTPAWNFYVHKEHFEKTGKPYVDEGEI